MFKPTKESVTLEENHGHYLDLEGKMHVLHPIYPEGMPNYEMKKVRLGMGGATEYAVCERKLQGGGAEVPIRDMYDCTLCMDTGFRSSGKHIFPCACLYTKLKCQEEQETHKVTLMKSLANNEHMYYKDYKGFVYQVLMIADDRKHKRDLVIYKSITSNYVWAMDKEEFFGITRINDPELIKSMVGEQEMEITELVVRTFTKIHVPIETTE